ncbi:hypothetical protein OPT61_g4522 [Boeremia exigua]|uniref:Uncharacterized protein n=1 Tax=Boeremia exigua TaxID=749465 RepID=A0ACC2IDW9_9PLEO|nr:hypothetical protein OPT61_g4522 [Boeremia exigua]
MLFNFQSLALQLLAAATCVSALPTDLEKRATIAHDAVVGFAQAVPSGTVGTLMLKHKPYLKVFNGCVSFPAVDAAGNTGGGLSPTGAPEGGCSSSTGQVYARAGTYNGKFGIMYSWYMPKDSPSTGLGHRHDWENIVVWLSAQSTSATVTGVAISAHGDYQKKASPPFQGNGPKIGYISYFPVNHQLIDTNDLGGQQPLIAWDSMTAAARSAIESTAFGENPAYCAPRHPLAQQAVSTGTRPNRSDPSIISFACVLSKPCPPSSARTSFVPSYLKPASPPHALEQTAQARSKPLPIVLRGSATTSSILTSLA